MKGGWPVIVPLWTNTSLHQRS